MIQSALLKFNSLFRKPFGADLLILCDDSLGSFGLVRIADPVSRTMQTGKKACIHAGLRRFKRHSHSIVAVGFGERS